MGDLRTGAVRWIGSSRPSAGSVGDTLALDHGHPARSRADGKAGVDAHWTATEAYQAAIARRRALEASRLRWLPHGRARLAHARQQEAAALQRLQRVERLAAEKLHAARQFVSPRARSAHRAATRTRSDDPAAATAGDRTMSDSLLYAALDLGPGWGAAAAQALNRRGLRPSRPPPLAQARSASQVRARRRRGRARAALRRCDRERLRG